MYRLPVRFLRAACAALALGIATTATLSAQLSLTILHNNDGESRLSNLGGTLTDFGGIARFATLVAQLRATAEGAANDATGVVLLSSGDNFLASKEFYCSQSLPETSAMYDAVALDYIDYDALALGNHEFDFGPEVLARFIGDFTTNGTKFLSSNLDFSGEASLQSLVNSGDIASRTVITVDTDDLVGVIGLTTPSLPLISSPGSVVASSDLADIVNAHVDTLEAQGVTKIILISHLQSIAEELSLAANLSGVDVIIAGGGDELLADAGDVLIPGHSVGAAFGSYPLVRQDADNNDVYVVTTPGNYGYVGRLMIDFDADGVVTSVDGASSLVRVAGGTNSDAVAADSYVQTNVVDPILDCVAGINSDIIGESLVPLNGLRSNVRTNETNLGNLITDGYLWQSALLASDFGVDVPNVALANGGGIRNDAVIPAGDISTGTTFDILPFTNFLAVVEDIPAAQFKEILENAVSRVEFTDGRFAQVAGFRFTYDLTGTAQTLDGSGNVTRAGSRVKDVVLDDGTVLVDGGTVTTGAPSVDIATADFSARGGDNYPFRGAAFTTLGVTYQQSLANYIESGLNGVISSSDFPAGGEGRILKTCGALSEDSDNGKFKYGKVNVGSTRDLSVTITNDGTCPIKILATRIDGLEADQFSIVSGAASPTISIAGGATHTVTVRFAPTSRNNKRADLVIVTEDEDNHTITIELKGTGKQIDLN
ncbi:MAG: 5'-nucleotidase C-terminal domain-containing protein [bacterium]|nr:5'-nucleotidase C-terminal domain-containing protein [Candidatus Kapabacteria bacterium]